MSRLSSFGAAVMLAILVACGWNDAVDSISTMEVPEDTDAILAKADGLWAGKDRDEALAYIAHAIDAVGERPKLLERYNDMAFALKRHELMLATARRLETADTRKSPWNQLKIAEALLYLGRPDEAMTHIECAVNERSFKRFQVFDGVVYDPLRARGDFQRCVQTARANIPIGSSLPDLTVRLLDGRELALRSLQGKVVLVDFWATWCRPCTKELPNLQALYREHAGQGFEIVSLSLDEQPEVVHRFVAEKGMGWPVCHLPEGWGSPIVGHYGINGLPSLWLYDRSGTLRSYDERGDALRGAVEQLL